MVGMEELVDDRWTEGVVGRAPEIMLGSTGPVTGAADEAYGLTKTGAVDDERGLGGTG